MSNADTPVVFHPLLSDKVCHLSSFKFYSAYRRRSLIKSNLKLRAAGRKQLPTLARFQISPKLLPTTRNNMRSVQTDVKFIIQKCWELLAHNVAFVCTGLYALKNIVKETIIIIVIIYYHLN